MAKAREHAREQAQTSTPTLEKLERQIKALERRIAILEARQPKPALVEKMGEPSRSDRAIRPLSDNDFVQDQ